MTTTTDERVGAENPVNDREKRKAVAGHPGEDFGDHPTLSLPEAVRPKIAHALWTTPIRGGGGSTQVAHGYPVWHFLYTHDPPPPGPSGRK